MSGRSSATSSCPSCTPSSTTRGWTMASSRCRRAGPSWPRRARSSPTRAPAAHPRRGGLGAPRRSRHRRAARRQLGSLGPLVGVRHVVQGEPDDGFLDRPDIARGWRKPPPAAAWPTILLVHGHQLPRAIRCADAHPELRCVLDHVGKPRCRTATGRHRATAEAFARSGRATCASSRGAPMPGASSPGLAYEAGPQWAPRKPATYLDLARGGVRTAAPALRQRLARVPGARHLPLLAGGGAHHHRRALATSGRASSAPPPRAAYRIDARAARSRAALSEAKP